MELCVKGGLKVDHCGGVKLDHRTRFLTRIVGSGFAFLAFFEPVAGAVHLKDLNVVGKPIQEGSRESLRSQNLRPLVEGQIAGSWR